MATTYWNTTIKTPDDIEFRKPIVQTCGTVRSVTHFRFVGSRRIHRGFESSSQWTKVNRVITQVTNGGQIVGADGQHNIL